MLTGQGPAPATIPASSGRTAVGDPVDVVTGECFVERTDFSLPGPIPVHWETYYSSQSTAEEAPLGRRWTHKYDTRLVMGEDTVEHVDGRGGRMAFPALPAVKDEVEGSVPGFVLRRHETHAFSVRRPDGTISGFERSSPAASRLAFITDDNRFVVRLHYGKQGRLEGLTDSAGRRVELTLDERGRITRVDCSGKEGRRRLVSYRYDGGGRLVIVVDGSGAEHEYEYDPRHRLLRRRDRNGYSFHYRYDEEDRCIRAWGDDGLYTAEFKYDPDERSTLVRGFDGRHTKYEYDDRGLVTREEDSYGRERSHTYDVAGRRTVTTDRCGRSTITMYNDFGKVSEEVTPAGERTVFEYDRDGRLIREERADGKVRTYEYDERGNLLREVADGRATIHRYDELGRRILTKPPGGLQQVYEYDDRHQLTRILDPLGRPQAEYEYDLLGNVTSATGPDGRTEYGNDDLCRTVAARYPDGTSEANTYDAEGNLASYRDRSGRAWRYRHGSREQLHEVVHPDGGVCRYEYTKADELCAVVDALDNRTEYEYDRTDHLMAVLRNGQVLDKYRRDGEGRLTEKLDAEGRTLARFEYDEFDGPSTREIYGEGPPTRSALEYDDRGRLTRCEDRWASIERAYHPSGSIRKETCDGVGVVHEFDKSGRLVSTDFGDGVRFRQAFHGDTVVLRDPGGGWHARRVVAGDVERWEYASGARASFSRDREGRLAAQVLRGADGQQIHRSEYDYDAAGRLTKRRKGASPETYDYDECGRLQRVRRGDGMGEAFRYDQAGNLLPSGEDVDPERSVVAGNRLRRWGERRFRYDDRGRLMAESGPRARRYLYDSADQLIGVERGGEVAARYEYDAQRRRVAKEVDGRRTRFGWEGDRLAWELMPSGTRRCYFYPDPESHVPVSFCDAVPSATGEPRLSTYFVHSDWRGHPVAILDSDGRAVWTAEWSAYGSPIAIDSDPGFEYRLRAPGQYHDRETGLHYNYHRYYDPEIGRYIQPDPIGLAGGLNVYEYLGGDPLRGCEVLGLADT